MTEDRGLRTPMLDDVTNFRERPAIGLIDPA